jgi:alpha-L-fucosidase
MKHFIFRPCRGLLLLAIVFCCSTLHAETSDDKTQWFRDAKFGIFMHWGLYSQLGNEWKGKSYYGSGEWLMNRAKIPVAEYEQVAHEFNPTNFDAEAWAKFVHDCGARYLVITAKHHEGFAMYGSKALPYNIVDATPYHQDPMKSLSEACRREGVKFGFYYSQFLDWHEPNGGGNKWDFSESNKNYRLYYDAKSIPQIRELLSNYGPLGLIWFDMPGGLSRDETASFMDEVRHLQPQCLVSSRVGNGFGDFRDLGDSELPPNPVNGAWEALFTHNDSWGFATNDRNFKSPREILRLLASTAARGGNFLLNVGPDGTGRLPEYSVNYLREVGRWLNANGESIYGTTGSPIPDQPWGVATLKPGRLFLHVFDRPHDGSLLIPDFNARATRAGWLGQKRALQMKQHGNDLMIELPAELPDARDSVVEVDFTGTLGNSWSNSAAIISRQFDSFTLDAAKAQALGNTLLTSVTSSRYFGNWKHDVCAQKMKTPSDRAEFSLRFLEPGDYRISLEYFCSSASAGQDGIIKIGEDALHFQTLLTGEYDSHEPLVFIRHPVGVVSIKAPGIIPATVLPANTGQELFWLRRLVVEPVR